MLYSHHFDSAATLDRARFWLTWHGFAVVDSTVPSDPTRLAVRVTFAEAAAVRALVDSIEHTQAVTPMKSWRVDAPSTASPLAAGGHAGTPIHWGPRDDAGADPQADRVAEYMFGRWE